MATIPSSRPTPDNIFSVLRSGKCLALARMKKLSESNLKELADAFQISPSEPLQNFLGANYDVKASLAELVYIKDAYQLAQSGKVDEINSMTDLQLRIVAYGKNLLPHEELYDRNSFQMRLLLLAKFAHGPELPDEKIVLTKANGAVMRF